MRPRRAPPPPPPRGLGLHDGGSSRGGGGDGASDPRAGGGRPGPVAAPLHLQKLPTPVVGSAWTWPPPSGWPPPPPALLRLPRARRAVRGGARGPPKLGPRGAGPDVPTSCHSLRAGVFWDGPSVLGSPELRTRLTTPLSTAVRSFRGRTMGNIARLRTESAWQARRGYPGTEAAGRLRGTLAGVTAECPPQADPRAPAIASLPCAALGSFASKTKTNPIPPPCLPEEGERERRGG